MGEPHHDKGIGDADVDAPPWRPPLPGGVHDRQRQFADLFETHGRRVLAWAARRTQPASDAQDILGETFTICWRRLDDVPPGDAALPWLFAVASGVLSNHRRSEERRRRLLGRLQGERSITVSQHPEDVRVDRLDHAMSRLRPADAEVLRLAAWEGFGPSELAETLSCTSNAASIRLHRAKQALLREYASLIDLGEHASGDATFGREGGTR